MKLLGFVKHFDSEESCEKHLKEVREREGVVYSKCGCREHYWNKARKSWKCKECGHETTLTAGTVMHGSNLPLMCWFTAMHLLTSTKKTFSAKEMQRQLGHKRYQPIWEMMHKLRSVMGKRDSKYELKNTIELDEAYFTTENLLDEKDQLKRGVGSQRKTKVLVMVESERVPFPKKGKKDRECNHIKMSVIENLDSETFEKAVEGKVSKDATVVMDNLKCHAGVEKVTAKSERQTDRGEDAPKILLWVHVAISNAKALFTDMYHGIKSEFLQECLNEFCYKFNRMYFDDRTFDRLMVASVSYQPTFKHRKYGSGVNCG